MKPASNVKVICCNFISLAFILLFIYAAINKLLDFETFKVQLGQSPLLGAYTHWVVFAIPCIEILISLLLALPKLRYIGFLFSFGLMIMFTVYIIIILNYSAFVPCSCGGILSEMNWTQHLIFNIVFVLLALTAVLLNEQPEISIAKRLFHSLGIAVIGSITVIILFFLSEEEIHRNNGFIRSYPHHPVGDLKGISLKYNSYYIAGFEKDQIILGNSTAPLHILSIDTSLKKTREIRIKIEDSKDYQFSSIKVKVQSPHFYLGDGSIPIIYEGSTNTWKAKTVLKAKNYITLKDKLSDSEISLIVRKINDAINSFVGKKFATDEKALEIKEKIAKTAPTYIAETILDLNQREKYQRRTALFWYILGFISLISGIVVAFWFSTITLDVFKGQENWSLTTFYALKSIFIIILLIASSKYSFTLAKSYMSESLKIADRIHAISFGKFYLQVFNDRINPEEIKEIFRDWNINNQTNNFSNQSASDYDPKIIERTLELIDKIKNTERK